MTHLRIFGIIIAAGTGLALAQSPGAPAQPPQQTPQAQQTQQGAPSEITIHSGRISDKDRKAAEKAEEEQQPKLPMPALSNQPMTHQTRIMVMRSLNAETVFARKALPLGQRGVVLKDGRLSPPDRELAMLVATYGPAVKPGDRAQITDIRINDKDIVFELNGGPKKKKKWYQRIEIGGMGGSTPISREDPNQANAAGTTVELAFDKFVPEMTGDQVRELLSPILDFHAKSAAEAYLETVPPKVKQAIKDHQVLVGMNKEMVQYAKGKPERKLREKDDSGKDYEEWIYGEPPQEVQFVRFNGDEVVLLKVMAVDGKKIVRDQKEVTIENGTVALAKKAGEEADPKAKHAPSLKRPGDAPDTDSPTRQTGVKTPPPSTSPQQDEEWGKPKTTPPAGTTDPNAPKAPDSDASVPKL